MKTFLIIEEKGNLNFNASSTFDYQTGKGVEISLPENPNLNPAATVANSFTKEVDDRMRQCEIPLLLSGSAQTPKTPWMAYTPIIKLG